MLLDLIGDVRRGLPRGKLLSMTALASWCDTEDWLEQAPVDEVVPMLFRMTVGGEALRKRLAAGGDFRNPRCRAALGIATEAASTHLHRWTFAKPSGRRENRYFLGEDLVGVCGDAWSDKPRVEAAYLSGLALGEV